jgi:hypothetical protein
VTLSAAGIQNIPVVLEVGAGHGNSAQRGGVGHRAQKKAGLLDGAPQPNTLKNLPCGFTQLCLTGVDDQVLH